MASPSPLNDPGRCSYAFLPGQTRPAWPCAAFPHHRGGRDAICCWQCRQVGRRLSFTLDPPANELLLRHRTHDIRVRLRGDEVTAMDNFGQKLTFFDPIL